MPQLVTLGSELIRINPSNGHIEYSTSGGRTWMTRYSGSGNGRFLDLLPYAGKLLALTEKGIYCSSSAGRSWLIKSSTSIVRSFVALQDGGKEIIGMTADGHIYASSSEGATWLRRR